MAQQNQSTDSQQSPQQGAPDLSDVDQLRPRAGPRAARGYCLPARDGRRSPRSPCGCGSAAVALATRCEQRADGALGSRLDAARARRIEPGPGGVGRRVGVGTAYCW
ncbi:exodeoxyribonuclease VII small subunit [Kocuria rhizophila]|nr:exodeoxyribonuclease VII small subunit [Kocuria rhizophila]